MTYEELRQETRSEKFQKYLKETLGHKCVCCGSEDGIEYHHIVPLKLGGTNKASNIVPLCGDCHMKAHGCIGMMGGRRVNMGRPKKRPPNGYKDILFRYVHGIIGRSECEKNLNITGMRIYKAWFYKEYLHDYCIEKVKNHVDLLTKKGGVTDGKVVSEIWFYDETHDYVVKEGSSYYFQSTGNDVYAQPEQMTLWQAQ